MSSLTFSPFLPPFLLGVSALVASALLIWSAAHSIRPRPLRAVLLAFRLLALGLLVVLLLQPKLRIEENSVLRPMVAVVVDNSQSMVDIVDPKQPDRSSRAKEWLERGGLGDAQKYFDVRFFHFDQRPTESHDVSGSLHFDGRGSNIVSSLAQVASQLKGQPLEAILLLSDGLDTSGASPTSIPAGVPIDTFELERPFTPDKPAQSLTVTSVECPGRAFVGKTAELKIGLHATGMNGRTAMVELWGDGHKIDAPTVAFSADAQSRQVIIPISRGESGTFRYEVRVPGESGQPSPDAHPVVIDFMEPGNRILYIQNSLGFDFKFLRRAILSDRNLELSSFVRWADGRLASLSSGGKEAEKPLDLSPENLRRFAVILIGDLAPDALSQENYRALRDYVDRGGGLILLGGPNLLTNRALAQTALAELLPIQIPAAYRQGSFPVEITETGLHHPAFGNLFARVKDFPPLLTCNLSSATAPTAEILLETRVDGATYPVVAARRFGGGRVVTILTDTLWRWRLASGGWASEISPYDTFWSQTIDWLLPKDGTDQGSERVEVFVERPRYTSGEHPEVQAIYHPPRGAGNHPASLALKVQTPDGRSLDYTMRPTKLHAAQGGDIDGYTAAVEPNVAGTFKATATAQSEGRTISGDCSFTVNEPTPEKTGRPIDRDFLLLLAQGSGGRFYPMETWGHWRDDLHVRERHLTRSETRDLWASPFLAAALLALIGAEWVIRRRANLP